MTCQLDLDRRRMLGGIALGFGGAALAACGGRAGAQAAFLCAATPTEIKGPFPADGSNGPPRPINVLSSDAVIREDIRPSFAGRDGRAQGALLELELRLVDARTCNPLPHHGVYLWQNDAAGNYSLYDLPEANYLRGLQMANRAGELRFTTIIPGCYGGRYPHCHFELFSSAAPALGGEAPLLVSQFTFPEAVCREIYEGDARYGDSLRNLDRLPLARDFVFGDTGAAGQVVTLSGNLVTGYRGFLTIALG